MRAHPGQRGTVEDDLAPRHGNLVTDDGLHRRGFADPVPPDQADHLARRDLQVDPVQNLGLAIGGVQV